MAERRSTRETRRIIRRPQKGSCSFCRGKTEPDYRSPEELKRFVTDRGKIVGRGRSGLCQKHQRRVARAVKRARYLALLPFAVRVGV